MAQHSLFGVNQPVVAKHVGNIYAEGELDRDGTYSKMELVGDIILDVPSRII